LAPCVSLAFTSGRAHGSALQVVAKLAVGGKPADVQASTFASQMLGIKQLPALLLYPEASPGYLAYKGRPRSLTFTIRMVVQSPT